MAHRISRQLHSHTSNNYLNSLINKIINENQDEYYKMIETGDKKLIKKFNLLPDILKVNEILKEYDYIVLFII